MKLIKGSQHCAGRWPSSPILKNNIFGGSIFKDVKVYGAFSIFCEKQEQISFGKGFSLTESAPVIGRRYMDLTWAKNSHVNMPLPLYNALFAVDSLVYIKFSHNALPL